MSSLLSFSLSLFGKKVRSISFEKRGKKFVTKKTSNETSATLYFLSWSFNEHNFIGDKHRASRVPILYLRVVYGPPSSSGWNSRVYSRRANAKTPYFSGITTPTTNLVSLFFSRCSLPEDLRGSFISATTLTVFFSLLFSPLFPLFFLIARFEVSV